MTDTTITPALALAPAIKISRTHSREGFRQDKFSTLPADSDDSLTPYRRKIMTKDELHNTSKEQDNKPQTAPKEGTVTSPPPAMQPRYSPPEPRPPAPKAPFGMPSMPVARNIKVIKPTAPPKKDDPPA